VAALPALLYFLSVAMFVRIEARRSQAVGLEDETVPSLKEVLRGGWHFLLPLVVLVAALVYGFTPTYAAGIAILSVVLASRLSAHPMGIKDIMEALVTGTRNIMTTAILLITVGLIYPDCPEPVAGAADDRKSAGTGPDDFHAGGTGKSGSAQWPHG